tara:strand:+ start:295 stop:579 length:285 start_codon:yes stop_codon:yes gene_type:complete
VSEIQTLTEGINKRQFVRIRYQKPNKEFKKPKPGGHIEKGEIVIRKVEPYEIKEKNTISYLWACDSRNGAIKSFNIENIKSARLLPQTFQPRTF